ncbi:MAG: HD domain-containing protein [Desulfobacula sp.]|nr:HD domain-containing protein [Desulfobacula sp.]
MPTKGRLSGQFSKNNRINIVIENILEELCPFLEEQAREISEMTAIGKALSTGKNISVLLEMILSIARRFSKADGGTLYLVDDMNKYLKFHVIQNESLNIKKEGSQIDLPGVALFNKDKTPNLSNVSSYVFHTGEIVNIKDVYQTKRFHFDGTKEFDKALKYKSKSMVVIPMKNHEDDTFGILQLINATDALSKKTIPFSLEVQEKATALASQASMILTQQTLIFEMKELFEAFIRAIAVSIDEKSKHTGGHIQRVTQLAIMIAEKINQDQVFFKDTMLSEDQIDELRIAALMHDTGKITTPDHIIGKSTRLETIFDRIELIKTRWELFKSNLKLKAAQEKLALSDHTAHPEKIADIDRNLESAIARLDKEFNFLSFINSNKAHLENEHLEQLKAIQNKSYEIENHVVPYLTDDEIENLSIQKGTLTHKERDIINSHAYVTEKILNKLPWPRKLSKIPAIAGAHHEKLDGSGYPLHIDGKNLNIQARILAVADIFEALSAQDRPYKNPMSLSQTVKVLKSLGDTNKIDKDIVSLFFKTRTHIEYAKRHLSPAQIDLDII